MEIGLHNYTVFRRDRHNICNSPTGGGILVAVKSSLKAKIIYISDFVKEKFLLKLMDCAKT